ncbi:hypothetical protein [Phytohabitans suffuscus]|uniref:hypothetical protein n=1 Tax=Phytohabitans suffuscus TaxID=624315 RepID=UPI0015658CF3|nr:hypothetical protein [Phytohabitans suffuscus]
MLSATTTRRWSLPAVAVGVAATAAAEFFRYPLDAALWPLALAIAGCLWPLATAAALAGTVLTFWHRGGGDAALLALIAFIGLATVFRADLDLGYPRAYHLTHRGEFAQAAARGETVRWTSNSSGSGYGYAYLPSARRGEELTVDGTAVTATAALGDGWWWVSSFR